MNFEGDEVGAAPAVYDLKAVCARSGVRHCKGEGVDAVETSSLAAVAVPSLSFTAVVAAITGVGFDH